ncbi:MAG: hypothetical protein ILP16_05825 [Spirochaetales bacterium]|nr:hypothetical protein [Spirochaetales bacterium]
MRNEVVHRIKRILGKNVISVFYRSLWFLSDERYLRLIYRLRMGKKLDLENPRSFNEKLQWLKLNDRNPEHTRMADKIGMRSYVSERIGDGHTAAILGVWNRFNEIDFNALPDRFVLKTTHDSGSYIICRHKSKLDMSQARRKLERSLRRNYYRTTREWQYRDIQPRIIAEEYLDDGNECLTDYKFFCLNGKPYFMYVEQETAHDPGQTIVDMDFNLMPFLMEDRRNAEMPQKPLLFDQMREYAEKLAEGTPFLRVDLYCIGKTIYVGELTFYHYGGFIPFNPAEWDLKLGEKLDIERIRSRI